MGIYYYRYIIVFNNSYHTVLCGTVFLNKSTVVHFVFLMDLALWYFLARYWLISDIPRWHIDYQNEIAKCVGDTRRSFNSRHQNFPNIINVSQNSNFLLIIVKRIYRLSSSRATGCCAKLENRYDLHFMLLRDLFLFPIYKGNFFFSLLFKLKLFCPL